MNLSVVIFACTFCFTCGIKVEDKQCSQDPNGAAKEMMEPISHYFIADIGKPDAKAKSRLERWLAHACEEACVKNGNDGSVSLYLARKKKRSASSIEDLFRAVTQMWPGVGNYIKNLGKGWVKLLTEKEFDAKCDEANALAPPDEKKEEPAPADEKKDKKEKNTKKDKLGQLVGWMANNFNKQEEDVHPSRTVGTIVTCPPGVGPGQPVQVVNPESNETWVVDVPRGVRPGEQFKVMFHPPNSDSKNDKIDSNSDEKHVDIVDNDDDPDDDDDDSDSDNNNDNDIGSDDKSQSDKVDSNSGENKGGNVVPHDPAAGANEEAAPAKCPIHPKDYPIWSDEKCPEKFPKKGTFTWADTPSCTAMGQYPMHPVPHLKYTESLLNVELRTQWKGPKGLGQCQQHCKSTQNCKAYSFWSNGGCHLVVTDEQKIAFTTERQAVASWLAGRYTVYSGLICARQEDWEAWEDCRLGRSKKLICASKDKYKA